MNYRAHDDRDLEAWASGARSIGDIIEGRVADAKKLAAIYPEWRGLTFEALRAVVAAEGIELDFVRTSALCEALNPDELAPSAREVDAVNGRRRLRGAPLCAMAGSGSAVILTLATGTSSVGPVMFFVGIVLGWFVTEVQREIDSVPR